MHLGQSENNVTHEIVSNGKKCRVVVKEELFSRTRCFAIDNPCTIYHVVNRTMKPINFCPIFQMQFFTKIFEYLSIIYYKEIIISMEICIHAKHYLLDMKQISLNK